jgi:8-oxo-dGTP diphosphatase
MPVVLIRHAQPAKRRDWPGDDIVRPLSNLGNRQAVLLAGILRPYSPQRVLTSPYTRCVQTVTPLATWLGLPTETTGQLGEEAGQIALTLIRSLAEEKVVLCTHGDVIADVLTALADEDHLGLGIRPRQARASAWVLEADDGRFVSATYLAPPIAA